MASGSAAVGLTVDKVTALAQKSSTSRALSPVHFVLSEASGSANPTLAVCFVVYVRQGGFMLALPNSQQLQDGLLMAPGVEVPPVFHQGQSRW